MAGSDFSIDFAAVAPQIYSHDTGGGAFEDKTINVDAVESLEGGDFAVGDIVSYYFNVVVAPNAVDRFPQTIEVDVSFLVNTTGQTGVSHRDIVGVSANYYTGEFNSSGEIEIVEDTALIDNNTTDDEIVFFDDDGKNVRFLTDDTANNEKKDTSKQVIFVDSQIKNYQALTTEITVNTEVIILDRFQDGVRQITDVLKQKINIDSIHILAHGSPGYLYLGNSKLTLNTIDKYTDDLKTWLAHSLFIYGCNFAANDSGRKLIKRLSNLTKAKIAASTTPIGHVSQGGNWQLDYRVEPQTSIVNKIQPFKRENITNPVSVTPLSAKNWDGILGTSANGDLEVIITSAPNLVVDHNENGGPTAAHLSATITNNGEDTLTDVWFYMGEFVTDTNFTIGTYATTTTASGDYSFTHEGGASDAARYIGTIEPGETIHQYWLASYPINIEVFGSKPDISDDTTLDYDVWVTAEDPIDGSQLASQDGDATLRAEIAASANKIWPNTTSKVPDEYLNAFEEQLGWRPETSPTANGTTELEGVWYDMGRVVKGIDYDGDFIPDHDIWLQPVGDPSQYNPSTTRLVHNYGVLIVKLNDGTEQIIAFEDQLYHKDIPANNTGVVGLVFFEFAQLDSGSSSLTPYQQAASGDDNIKYNGDYGRSGGEVTFSDPSLTFNKTAGSSTVATGGTLTYTLSATNTDTGTVALGNLSYGTPLVMYDDIPEGTVYAGGAETGNTVPNGTNLTVFYSIDNGITWDDTAPGDLTTVTDLQWWLDAPLPAGETFTATFDVTTDAAPLEPYITNTGGVGFAGGTLFSDETTTLISGSRTISGTAFADDGGTTGTALDAIFNGDEASMGNIDITLYYDSNSDGAIDSGDFLWATTTSSTADGTYSFANLPDGNWIVEVNREDVDKTAGYSLSSEETYDINLAGSDSTGNDFGFGPVLQVDKQVPTDPINEGEEVTYTIDVTNLLSGEGGGSSTLTQTGSFSTATDLEPTEWTDPGNAVDGIDGTNATSVLGGGSAGTTELVISNLSGITEQDDLLGLDLAIDLGVPNNSGNDSVTIDVSFASGANKSFTKTISELYTDVGTGGELLLNLDDAGTTWADLTTNAASAQVKITYSKSGGNDGVTLSVDGATFQAESGVASSGSGTAYDLWISEVNPSTAQFTPNANLYGAPDGNFATAPWGNTVTGGGFTVPSTTANITKVEIVAQVYYDGTIDNDTWGFDFRYNDGFVKNFTFSTSDFISYNSAANAGEIVLDITNDSAVLGAVGSWDWADFGSTYTAGASGRLLADKVGGGSDSGNIPYVDAFGFRVTTDEGTTTSTFSLDTTIANVPLVDNYDPSKLKFVSASVTPDIIDETTGTLTWNNVGGINAGDTNQIQVTYEALEPLNNTSESISNTASVTGATLANGEAVNDGTDTVNVTLAPTATIGDTIWSDKNSDGVIDGDEPGIPGVTVNLLDSGSNIIDTVVTDSSGNYQFKGVIDGTYTVQVDNNTLPTGFTATYDFDGTGTAHESSVTITSAADDTTQDFGYNSTTSSFFGNVWQDYDNDGGTPETGEGGLSGVTVQLLDSGDNVIQSTTTDSDGSYSFDGVADGDYRVNILTLPAGATWTQTADPDGTLDGKNTTLITVSGGDISGSHDFGYYATGTASIGDTVFYDWNQDGIQDASDEGIPNLTVTLYTDTDGDGVYDADSDPIITTTTTAADGTYSFTSLPAGDYVVVVDESDTDFPSDVNGLVTNPASVTLTAGETNNDVDFPYYKYGDATISGNVWYDQDGDTTKDNFETTNLANIQVTLLADLNGDGNYVTVQTVDTDADGNYSFTSLPDGDYQIVVDDTDTDLPVDSYGNIYQPTTATTTNVSIVDGADQTADFGFGVLATIGDTIYYDANANGTQDINELGIAGVTVNLLDESNNVVATTTTEDGTGSNPEGYYLFTGVEPGTYTVAVDTSTLPSGLTVDDNTDDPDRDGVPSWDNTYPSLPAADAQDSDVIVTYGTNYQGADFGFEPSTVIGDYIWLDQNGDGIQDSSEVGLSGVDVSITDGTNTFNTTTDSEGFYFFQDLTAGDWTITVTQPADMSPSSSGNINDLLNGNGSVGANTATVTVDATGTVTQVDGNAIDDGLKIDFGYEFSGTNSVSGTVVLEEQGTTDGNSGEPTDVAVEGLTVFIYKDNGGSPIFIGSTETDASGNYDFGNLPDDTYYISLATNLPLLENTSLTTTATDTSADTITPTLDSENNVTSVYQTIAISSSSTVTGVDFAFESNVNYDFGDLPESYSTNLTDDGARHIVPDTPTLYLGTAPDTEFNGQPTVDANGDGADEDGITIVDASSWNSTSGGTLDFNVTGTGYLVGWIDWDNDGNFTGINDLVISQSVTTGTNTIAVNMPEDGYGEFYARFRLFEEEPAVPTLAYQGSATNGEVEDAILAVGQTPTVTISDVSDYEGESLVFDLTLDVAHHTSDIVLDLATASGTATDGVDYENTNFEYSTDGGVTWTAAGGTNGTQVTIPSGLLGIQVRIDSVADGDSAESDETFTLSVGSVVSGDAVTSDTGTGTIIGVNNITGTGLSETLTNSTADIDDFFVGGAGQDTLTGNGGNDIFHFNRTSDGIDIITDFDAATDTTFNDRLDFRDIAAVELSGVTVTTNLFDDGYINAKTFDTTGVMIQVDVDGVDDQYDKNVVLLAGVSVGDIDASDFIF